MMDRSCTGRRVSEDDVILSHVALADESERSHKFVLTIVCLNGIVVDIGLDADDVVCTLVADEFGGRDVHHLDVLRHDDVGGHFVVDVDLLLC